MREWVLKSESDVEKVFAELFDGVETGSYRIEAKEGAMNGFHYVAAPDADAATPQTDAPRPMTRKKAWFASLALWSGTCLGVGYLFDKVMSHH